MRLWVALVLVCGLSLACPVAPGAPIDGGEQADAGELDAGPAAGAADAGFIDQVRFVAGCSALPSPCSERDAGPDCGLCQYRVRIDTARCSPSRPCDNLLLLWAAMTCDTDSVADTLDRAIAGRPGWVTACVQPLFPGELLPTTMGAPARDELVLAELFATLRTNPTLGAWNGKGLLHAGCSAGATRYPVVAARTTADELWLGAQRTGACFSDGVVNLPYQDDFIGAGMLDGGASCAQRHRRMVEAFTRAQPLPGHGCSASPQGQCTCDPAHTFLSRPGACEGGDCAAYESIVSPADGGFDFAPGVTAESFSVRHWKLVSEGSSFASTSDRCLKDVVPEAPFAGLCAQLDADPDTTCTLRTFPGSPHCGAFGQRLGAECVEWFDGLP